MKDEAVALRSAGGVSAPDGGQSAWLQAADGVRLRAAFWPGGDRGTAVFFQGRTEFIEKYYEPIGRFIDLGFSAAAIDWRGQGLSDRPLFDRRKGYVADFADFQNDVDALLAHLAAVEAPKPWVLVGHSMGGAISARTLMRQDPALGGDLVSGGAAAPFEAAVLSAPMLGIHGVVNGGPIARAIAGMAVILGMGERYTLGCDRKTAAEHGFDGNVLTTDRERFARMAALTTTHDGVTLGGPTWRWLREALRETARLRPSSTPTLIAIGDADRVVSINSSERYVNAASNAQMVVLSGAKHEPFIETDAIQERLWTAIISFLDARGL